MASGIKRRRYANGPPRPTYLASPDADKAVMMILALAAEVSALRERLDTHERLAAGGALPTPSAVEAYEPPDAVEAARASARHSMIDRITRVLLEPTAPPRAVAAEPAPPSDQAEPSSEVND
jgi:hypothetical protein